MSVQLHAKLHEDLAAMISAGVVNRGRDYVTGPRFQPRRVEDMRIYDENDFASIHAKWCWLGLPIAVARGSHPGSFTVPFPLPPQLRRNYDGALGRTIRFVKYVL
ncbi:hypothetical protein FRB96_006400 [Tulasnella sp. 330]|nr:hypothetical protein FRB96_006400 [Tulasnella sp. 330]